MTDKRFPQTTVKPFPEALREFLDEKELSQRELIRQTRRMCGWGSMGAISSLLNEDLAPTIRSMEPIAQVLKIPPTYFAEYRLAKARESLDPSKVGLEAALENLARSGLGVERDGA